MKLVKVSRKADYALRVLVTLAKEESGTLLPIRHLAELNDVPKRFLEQIMLELRELGWVRAVIGRSGGYALAVEPSNLTMGRIIRHFDGILAPIGCVSVTRPESCSQAKNCRFRHVFFDIRNHVAGMLDCLTLADLTKEPLAATDEAHDLVLDEKDSI